VLGRDLEDIIISLHTDLSNFYLINSFTSSGGVLLSGRTRGEVGGAGKGSRGQNNQPPY